MGHTTAYTPGDVNAIIQIQIDLRPLKMSQRAKMLQSPQHENVQVLHEYGVNDEWTDVRLKQGIFRRKSAASPGERVEPKYYPMADIEAKLPRPHAIPELLHGREELNCNRCVSSETAQFNRALRDCRPDCIHFLLQSYPLCELKLPQRQNPRF
jgi:hypothetical protein